MFEKQIHLNFESQSGHGSNVVISIGINSKIRDAEYKFCQILDISHSTLKSMKFIFRNKELNPDMKICQSGLEDMSRILVIETHNVIGA